METNGNPFLKLENELRPFFPLMGKAADTILDSGISSYPVFICAQQEIAIGVTLLSSPDSWIINATTLEELVTKQIVTQENIPNFRSVYKDPATFLCIFVVLDTGSNFIFVPRPS
jgi:hypothetical protein